MPMRFFSFLRSPAAETPGPLMSTLDAERIAAMMQAFGEFGVSIQRASEALARLADLRLITFPEGAMEASLAYLLEHLTPGQRDTFERHRFFLVQGKRYRWRITPNAYGVNRLGRSGRRRGVYCAVPQEPVPIFDVMLAQKLMLESDEDAFLLIANRAPNRRFIDHPEL